MKYKVGDKFILHGGKDYLVKIVNVNEFREMPYAVDIYYNGEPIYNDVQFVSDEFIDRLEKIDESTTESKEV